MREGRSFVILDMKKLDGDRDVAEVGGRSNSPQRVLHRIVPCFVPDLTRRKVVCRHLASGIADFDSLHTTI